MGGDYTENVSIVEVMQELATIDDDTSSEDDDHHEVDFSEGVPPVNFSSSLLFETNGQVNDYVDTIANDTIDLTNSPIRHSQISTIASPRQEQFESPPNLKCPVCMED